MNILIHYISWKKEELFQCLLESTFIEEFTVRECYMAGTEIHGHLKAFLPPVHLHFLKVHFTNTLCRMGRSGDSLPILY